MEWRSRYALSSRWSLGCRCGWRPTSPLASARWWGWGAGRCSSRHRKTRRRRTACRRCSSPAAVACSRLGGHHSSHRSIARARCTRPRPRAARSHSRARHRRSCTRRRRAYRGRRTAVAPRTRCTRSTPPERAPRRWVGRAVRRSRTPGLRPRGAGSAAKTGCLRPVSSADCAMRALLRPRPHQSPSGPFIPSASVYNPAIWPKWTPPPPRLHDGAKSRHSTMRSAHSQLFFVGVDNYILTARGRFECVKFQDALRTRHAVRRQVAAPGRAGWRAR